MAKAEDTIPPPFACSHTSCNHVTSRQAIKCIAPMGIRKYTADNVKGYVESCLFEKSQADAVLSMYVKHHPYSDGC